jgi:TatD DNase family protein
VAERQHRRGQDVRPPLPDALPVGVVDGHTHLDHEDEAAVGALLLAAARVGVDRSVQIGCDLPAARWTVEAVQRHPALVGGVALHPNLAPALAAAGGLDAALAEIADLATRDRVRVVGETGLDWFRTDRSDDAARRAQEESFRAHIELAKRLGLPLQIHDRDAHDDVLRVLADAGAPERTVLHCFSGDAQLARHCVEQGWYLSFAGTVTFRNAGPLRAALAEVPLGQLQVETDAPYLTPAPWRGRPNAGYLVPLTVRTVATVLDRPLEQVCAALAGTADHLYGPW